MSEYWKPVPGYEALYEVSTLGKVRSLGFACKCRGGGIAKRPGRVLKHVAKENGYACVSLTGVELRPRQYFVHDLVLLAFVGPKPIKYHTRHLNGIRSHNTLENLAYGTCKENTEDRRQHGTLSVGSKHGMSKLTEAEVAAIRASSLSKIALAKRYGVGYTQIWSIQSRRSWKHI